MSPSKATPNPQELRPKPEDKNAMDEFLPAKLTKAEQCTDEQIYPEGLPANYPDVGFYDPVLHRLCRRRPVLLHILQLERQREVMTERFEPDNPGVVRPAIEDWREKWVEQADGYLFSAQHFLTNILPQHFDVSAQAYQDLATWIKAEVREEAQAERQILIEDKYEDVPDNDEMDARPLFQIWQGHLHALLEKLEQDKEEMDSFPIGYQTRFNQEMDFIKAKLEEQSARTQQETNEALDWRLRTIVLPYIERMCDHADEVLKHCFPPGYQGWRTAELPPWDRTARGVGGEGPADDGTT